MNLDKFQVRLLKDSCSYSILRDNIQDLIKDISTNKTCDVGYELMLLSKMLGLSERLCNQIKKRYDSDGKE